MSSQPPKSDASSSWGVSCRPTLLFVMAFALNVTPHEIVHAITSYLLGFNSTVFQMWVNPDSAEAAPRQLAIIAASGPLFSLALGAVCWMLYQRRFRDRPSGLAFLMIAMVGIYSFLGPLAGAALARASTRPSSALAPSIEKYLPDAMLANAGAVCDFSVTMVSTSPSPFRRSQQVPSGNQGCQLPSKVLLQPAALRS